MKTLQQNRHREVGQVTKHSYSHGFSCTDVVLLAIEMFFYRRECQPVSVKRLSWQRYLTTTKQRNVTTTSHMK